MPWYYYLLIFWFAIINCLGALFICLDKHRARKRQWRVPERTLLLFAWLGGCLGVYLAMQLIRHKTQTKKFTIGVPLIFLVHLLLAALLAWLLDGCF